MTEQARGRILTCRTMLSKAAIILDVQGPAPAATFVSQQRLHRNEQYSKRGNMQPPQTCGGYRTRAQRRAGCQVRLLTLSLCSKTLEAKGLEMMTEFEF